ncbi:MAG: TetR/AcrR family transcriptional regulator, partial [Salinisphaera sp.]|nr:TetR/AcrR family transcriptional regulator [Salinisphaera sp.]
MGRRKDPEHVRARKREEILDAAMAVFEKHGRVEALSLRRLADEMNLSYSAPYRYFISKEDLLNALRTRAYRWIERSMLTAIADIASPMQPLEAIAAAYISGGIEHPHRYALMFFNVDDAGSSLYPLELQAAKRDALDVCTRVIASLQTSGRFPQTMDPLTASHLFWA